MSNSPSTHENDENLKNYKYILGEMGIQILIAISRGANTKLSIRLFSGVPPECVNGRLPVLSKLKFISQIQEEYHLTERGNNFLVCIENE
jgi:hypothetical protein